MNRAKRRAACRRWGHLPSGGRCARCGVEPPELYRDLRRGPRRMLLTPPVVVLLCLVAALVGPTLGAFLDYLYL